MFINLKDESFIKREGRQLVFKSVDEIRDIYINKKEIKNISALISREEIAENNYSFAIDKYVVTEKTKEVQKELEKFELIRLEDIADIRKSQLFKDEEKGKFDEEDLEYFLEVYYKRKILIASFIQKLYRLVNLNFLISEKKIGKILCNILNTSSKTVTPKYIGIRGGTKKNSNTRVYDLNFNQTELDTKIKIATNLLELNLKELDIKQISKITDLLINQVEKIYKKIFIK
jgi:type I restriction-modification system DNA methylase subunit